MVQQVKSERKITFFRKFSKRLADCEKCFIVNVDNVSSRQIQQIRVALRGTAEVILGKNTMMKKVIQSHLARNPNLEKLVPHIRQNVGFVFTKSDLLDVRTTLEANRVAAPAKAGTIAQCDVVVPAQNTGLGPEKTSFFQALNIPTKIARGCIEIQNDVPLITKDSKVGMSEATLLSMLKIFPFTYGMVITQVYDNGSVFDAEVLDITCEMILKKFVTCAQNAVALSLATGHTTFASVPHLLARGFGNLLAISIATEYTFPQSAELKEYLADPSKFVTVAESAPVAGAPETAKPSAPAAPPPPESESDSDIGMGLFD